MGWLPLSIQKGPTFQKLDTLSRDRDRRRAFLHALKDASRDYVDIFTEFQIASDAQARHYRRHWYDPNWANSTDVWWPGCQPIEPLARAGMIRAFEEAVTRNLPVDNYWIGVGESFETSISWNERQITRIMLTPPPPPPYTRYEEDDPLLIDTAPIMVVRREKRVISDTYTDSPSPEDITNEIVFCLVRTRLEPGDTGTSEPATSG